MNPLNQKIKQLQKTLTEREYRPATVFYVPIAFYFVYLAIKARHLLFFSNIDPFMECSDFLDTSKYNVFKKLDKELLPETIIHRAWTAIDTTIKQVDAMKNDYPFIAKPDLGRRGSHIQPIRNKKQLIEYLSQSKGDTLIQQMIDWPIEVGVMYYHIPGQKKWVISGIMQRNFLTVIGDGKKTLKELLEKHPRANRYMKQLHDINKRQWDAVLNKGEELRAMPLGTHSRWTQFLDISEHITDKMVERFDAIAQQMNTFYFWRYDIRLASLDDLESGPIKILEVNGAPSEPAHAYDPQYNVLQWYKEFMFHRHKIYEIGKKNKKAGYPYMTLKEFYQLYQARKKLQ